MKRHKTCREFQNILNFFCVVYLPNSVRITTWHLPINTYIIILQYLFTSRETNSFEHAYGYQSFSYQGRATTWGYFVMTAKLKPGTSINDIDHKVGKMPLALPCSV